MRKEWQRAAKQKGAVDVMPARKHEKGGEEF